MGLPKEMGATKSINMQNKMGNDAKLINNGRGEVFGGRLFNENDKKIQKKTMGGKALARRGEAHAFSPPIGGEIGCVHGVEKVSISQEKRG